MGAMATRNDQAIQDRRRRLRERGERERRAVKQRQQAQTAALNDIDAAVERLTAARATLAATVTRAVEAFSTADELAEVTSFDTREIRALQREHQRHQVPTQTEATRPTVTSTSG